MRRSLVAATLVLSSALAAGALAPAAWAGGGLRACLGAGHCVSIEVTRAGEWSSSGIDGGVLGSISGGLSGGDVDEFSGETYSGEEFCNFTLVRRAKGTWGSESEPGTITCTNEEGAVTFESPIWIEPVPKEKKPKPPKPTITSVEPASGPLAGGNTVTINGSDFDAGDGLTLISIGRNEVAAECPSAEQCTVTAPAARKAGTVKVTAIVGKLKSPKSAAAVYTYE